MISKAHPCQYRWVLLLLIGISLLFCKVASAQQMPLEKPLLVTISGKSEETNQVFVKERRFRVPPGTTILDRRGKSLTLKQLVVPCKAQIYYRLSSSRESVVEKIQLK